jgi:glycosyltransferase involved in cell wall biosynthesis
MDNDKKTIPVSVIIPCYCCSGTIGRALHSVFIQSAAPAEIIIVDDCSNDQTPAILNEFAQAHPNMKVIALARNAGAASARNAGWLKATQPFIAFLDADDSWHPKKLEVQFQFMLDHKTVAVCGHQCAVLTDGFLPDGHVDRISTIKINAIGLLFKSAFSTPTVMLRRDIPFRFPEGRRFAEDAFLWQQIAFSGANVIRLEVPLAYLHKSRYGEAGLSSALWKMECGELQNISALHRAGTIGFALFLFATAFSLLKYVVRKCLSWQRKRGLETRNVIR